MKKLLIACLAFVSLSSASAENANDEFALTIEGVNCRIKLYQPKAPIIIEPLVDSDSLPDSRLLLAVMLQKSDITSYLSDERISELHEIALDASIIRKMRASTKRRFELTGPNAEANPWKGMKYVLDLALVVESEKGRYLVHQCSTQGGEVANGTLHGILKEVNGKWVVGNALEANDKKFKIGLMQLVPKELAKLQETGSIGSLPLEDLL